MPRGRMERSHPLPARLRVLEKETLFVSCWIWGFICNLENPTAPPHSVSPPGVVPERFKGESVFMVVRIQHG